MLPAPEWPPSAPSLSNFLEVAEARDLRWFIRAYWKWIAACGAIGALLGGMWVYFFPPLYVSQAAIRFLPPQVAGRYVNPNFSMEVGQRVFALSQLLGSRLTASKLIQSQGLYPERRRLLPADDLTGRFIGDLRILQSGNESGDDRKAIPTLRISFGYADPDKAKSVVQKLVEQVYEENRKYRGDQSLGTTEFLQEQLAASEERVLQAEQRLGEVQDTLGLTVSQTRLGQATSRGYVLDTRLRDLRHDRRQLDERKSAKRAEWDQLELLQRRIETRPAEFYIPDFEAMPHYWQLRDRVSAAKNRLERLKERYSGKMPDVSSAESDVLESETAVERFHKERGARLRGRDMEVNVGKIALVKLELQALDKEVAEQTREELDLRAEAQRLREQQGPPAGQEVEMLAAKREYEAAKEQHAELFKKHEESRAASEMERRGQGESVEMLEPATRPEESERPPWWLRITLASMASMGLAALGCLMQALRNPRILHGGHLANWAGLEVLASFADDEFPKMFAGRRITTALSCLALLVASGCGSLNESAGSLCRKGEAAERDGRINLALLHYRQAIKKDARYAPAYAAAARIALQLGELSAAREALTRVVELDPNEQRHVKLLAETTYQIYFDDPGRPTVLLREVEALGDKLRKRWPKLPDGYRILAQVLMERHRTEEAAEFLGEASKSVERNETLRAQMAAALFRLGRVEESESVLAALVDERPSYLDAYDLLYLQLVQRKQSGRAREVLEKKWNQTREMESVLQLAAHDDARGERESASRLLAGIAPDAGRKPLGMARIGDFWLQRVQWDQAWAAYSRGREIEPGKRAEYTGRMAELHLAKGENAQARALVEKEFAANPGSLLLEAYLAAVRLGEVPEERRTEERKRLESILQRMPDSPFVRYHLGRAYLLEKNWQPAAEQFERSVRLDANYAAGWLALAEMDLAQGNASGAEQRSDAVLLRNPRDLRAMITRARAQSGRGKLADAETTLTRVIAEEPSNLDAGYLLALAHARQGHSAEAAKLLERGHSREEKNPRWTLALAALAARQGRTAEARQIVEGALAATPRRQDLLNSLADLQIQMKDGAGARATFERLLALEPKNFEYELGLAGAMALAGDREAALLRYAKLQDAHANDLRVWLQPATLLGEMGRDQPARKAYEEALRRDRDNPFALNNLAWLLLRGDGNPREALELAQRAKRSVRQSQEVDGTLAEAYSRLSMNRNAEAIYQEMLSYVPASDQPRVERLLAGTRKKSKKGASS